MRDKIKLVLILFSIILAFCIFLLISYFIQRIPANDITVRGNTPGNLHNNGLFCESDGIVYFSNHYDGGCLYSMNPDETELKKLNNTNTYSINAGGDYLYFCMLNQGGGEGLGYVMRTTGLYRSKKNGKDVANLKKQSVITAQLCGNYLYYQNYNNKDYTQLYKVKIDRSEDTLVADSIIDPSSYSDGTIYFNGSDGDHHLYSLNTATDSITKIWDHDVWNPIYYNGFIYFMDIHENYRLCRYSPQDNTVTVLTSERVDYFNVGDSHVYYQTGTTDSPALKRVPLSGGEPEIIREGIHENINITSQYVYFNEFQMEVPVYHTPVYGPPSISTFEAAASAVMDN